VHNLVRGVAPPYPGAFTAIGGRTLRIFRTLRETAGGGSFPVPTLFFDNGRCLAQCAGGGLIRILDAELDGRRLDGPGLISALGEMPLALDNEKMKEA
jgi:methionyl-tRNA formyltransferase